MESIIKFLEAKNKQLNDLNYSKYIILSHNCQPQDLTSK